MRWKDKSNTTAANLAGDDVFPLTDVSTDQDKKATINVISEWVVTKFTTAVAGATQTIVDAINAVRTLAQDAGTAAATAQDGVDANASAIQNANAAIATNTAGIAGNASDIATLNQTMGNTNAHVTELEDQVTEMQEQIDTATQQADQASATAIEAANAASEAAEAVQEIIDQGGTVLEVFGRSGIVTAQAGDYSSDQITHGTGTVADKLTFDAIPVINSKKAVESGGVFTEMNKKVAKAGDTMTGTLIFKKNTQETTPPSHVYGSELQMVDGSNAEWGSMQSCFMSNGQRGITVQAKRVINGNNYYNGVRFLIDDNGNAAITIFGTGAADAWRNAIGAVGTSVSTYDHTKFTYASNFTYYATSGGNQPYASKQGRVVTLSGNFKNNDVVQTGSVVNMGKVPTGCEPLREVKLLQQGSSANKYLLTISTNGDIGISRYGTNSEIDVPSGSWLNISCTYISAS